MSKTLKIWKIVDGKQGHESQSDGLIAAIRKKREIEEFVVRTEDLPNPFCMLLHWIIRKKPSAFPSQAPDVIIGAGHKTHAAMLLAKSFCGGLTVVLMKPSLPLKRFDVVVVPKHDAVAPLENSIETNGVLNAVAFVKNKDIQKGLFLIGGESSHYRWDNARIATQIKEVVLQDAKVQWALTTSRRTPETFLELLQDIQVNIVPIEETDSTWMHAQFNSSGQIWVTPDSVSMVYEALSSGAATFVFSLEKNANHSRVRSGLACLVEDGAVMQYETWKEDPKKQHKPHAFDEASRVASFILERLA